MEFNGNFEPTTFPVNPGSHVILTSLAGTGKHDPEKRNSPTWAGQQDADMGPCTIKELEDIITAPAGGLAMEPSTAYDQILPGLYLGDGETAQMLVSLRDLGVTHVLNAAQGNSRYHVNTNPVKYKKHNISFLGIEATDFMNFDMSPFFQQAADFIEEGLKDGKVLVHCVQGISRSATLVIAYLMLKHHMTVQNAVRLVRAQREIWPNQGFLQQLCQFDETLRKSGHFSK